MEIITVRTAQNIDIDYEIGGLGERILAYLIDWGIFVALTCITLIVFPYIKGTGMQIYFWVCYIILLFYDLFCEVFFNGQSVGKLVMKIRVISLDGARPKLSQYLLRWLFRMVDIWVTLGLGGLITAAMTENGQRIGDLVAGTAIIKTSPRTKVSNLIYRNTDSTYKPVFMEAGQLKDSDVELIHEVISNYFKTGNSAIVYTMADKIKEYIGVTPLPKMNNLLFLQTIIKDHSHIAAHMEVL
ncbi:RDD family protein [Mucilaginibacter sp.]|uniref:RDD family protein n=1 Tax=Mucilaginibacter sp. TaxID=1882438 RepID=UPI002618F6DE|nr:RDD family protein [Mucilaginibacter sp.]MDB4922375.1 hypothetical protein [Mucilaginibacter sp.]